MSSIEIHIAAIPARMDALPADWISRLHPDEVERALRMSFERRRLAFIAGRLLLRQIFGSGKILIDDSGKPRFKDENSSNFSLSHSGSRVLLASSLSDDIGVDIEIRRPRPRLLAIAGKYFHPDEAEALRKLPRTGQLDAFLQLWTLKEAAGKLIGTGISQGMLYPKIRLNGEPEKKLPSVNKDIQLIHVHQANGDHIAVASAIPSPVKIHLFDHHYPWLPPAAAYTKPNVTTRIWTSFPGKYG